MGAMIASNFTLLAELNRQRQILNHGKWIQLFKNNFFPDSASTKIQFSRSDFPGYTPQSLDGAFKTPIKLKDGVYVSMTDVLSFPVIAAFGQTVFGWYIAEGSEILFSQRFDVPRILADGTFVEFSIPLQIGSIDVVCA